MGNAQSPSTDPRFVMASRAFTHQEVEDLNSLFHSLAAQSNSNGEYISSSVFKAYFSLSGPVGDRLFDLVTQQRKDQKLTFEDLVITKGVYEKGTKDEIEEFIYQLVDVTGDGIVGRSDLESIVIQIFNNTFSLKSNELQSTSDRDVVEIFVDASTFSMKDERCSFEDFKTWCHLLPSVRKWLGSLLMHPDPGRSGCQFPRLENMDDIDSNLILLRKEYAWHIGGGLSQNELEEWKLLYHSAVNGLSFTTFLGSTINAEGPTILIIKDKEGYIYGGHASHPWERHGDFYGDMKSFLFQLYPKASLFRPTGANNNTQWCAVNFSSESIPNGVGFGGRANHFGLFLSASFDEGHSFSCITFGSPCLSRTQKIEPEVIECWGVVPNAAQKERNDNIKGTVLERFKEERNLLNMVGIANSSQ